MEISFEHFLEKFPIVELPVTVSEDTYNELGAENEPLPALMIEQFLADDDDDDYTEYIACFRLPKQKGFDAIVFWKAGLLTYEYILTTYTKKGEPIAAEVIAGSVVQGDLLVQTVATIDKALQVFMATGASSAHTEEAIDPSSNKLKQVEIMDNGQIMESL